MFVSNDRNDSKEFGVSQRFKNEVARNGTKSSSKFGVYSCFVTSLSALIQFNTIISDAIDSFRTIVETCQLSEKPLCLISNKNDQF